MNILIRALWALALLAAVHPAPAQPITAAAVTVQPVRIIVPFLNGDIDDSVARIVVNKIDNSPRRPFVVENRPGDHGHHGAEVVAKARADGRTLLFAPIAEYAAAASLYTGLHYDLLAEFTPVTRVANAPHVLAVHPSLPVKSVTDLIAFAKAMPGQIKWGSHGKISLSRLEAEMFGNLGGVKIDSIPFSDDTALQELLAGSVALLFDSIVTTLPHLRSGKLRALAVAGTTRSPALAQVPTVAQAGVRGFEADYWYGILAPEGTDQAVVNRLNAEFAKAVNDDDVTKRLLVYGIEARGGSPAEFATIVRSEVAKWAQVIKRAGITPN